MLSGNSFFVWTFLLIFLRACDEEVECMCLPKSKFVELCEEFPASAKILKYKAYLRRKEFRKAKLDVQAANEKKLSNQKQWKLDVNKVEGNIEGRTSLREAVLNPKYKDKNRLSVCHKESEDMQVSGEQFLEHAKKLKVK